MIRFVRCCVAGLLACATHLATAGQVEVLHWWTSGGEAKSLAELKKIMAERGHTWTDFSQAGGAGDQALQTLRQRALAGNPPAAAQVKGPEIQAWAASGVLANMDTVAILGKWEERLPKIVADLLKYKGNYVAAPVNVHRVNWMWGNASVLSKAGVQTMPQSWDEFFVAADKVKKAGYVALAHGGQSWQDFTLFEMAVLGTGGAKLYNDSLVQMNPAAIHSADMAKALGIFRKLKAYTDSGSPNRDWNVATAMVINAKAGFQLMGDWAKGEFLAAGQKPGREFLCAAAPGTGDAFIFNVDSFILFRLRNIETQKAQGYLAYAMMEERFQEVFNLNKGSIPVRTGMRLDKFDDCARASAKDFDTTASTGKLVPSVAHGMALPPVLANDMKELVNQYWNNDAIGITDFQKRLIALKVKLG